MEPDELKTYHHIRSGGAGFYEPGRGLIAVWGKEAVQFLDGMITNDMKTLEDGGQMLAAFPDAEGRLLAVVRILRQGEWFFIETEEATREKVSQNLFRFTFAGDFFVEDLSDKYHYFEMFGDETPTLAAGFFYPSPYSTDSFIPSERAEYFRRGLKGSGATEIDDDLYDTIRIENGVPKYGIDMDETTIVPELGLERLISYNKGCYIGQEIIARIHFRGHVAKRLTGLVLDGDLGPERLKAGAELLSKEGKNAGRITSVTYSPTLDKTIALAYVRYEFLPARTVLDAAGGEAIVTDLPFI